jgi:curli biogenesis system outer membrane secretion channel CsgG
MKKSLIALALIFTGCAPMAEMIQNPGQPTVKVVSTTEQGIDQAQLEAYNGPKARVAVSQFNDKTAKGGGGGYGYQWYSPQIGNGMADMLSDGLLQSNRFIVLDRQAIGDVIREQDLGGSGRVRKDTAASIGEIEGADLLVKGSVTEFEPGSAGAGGGIGMGGGSWAGAAAAAIFSGFSQSHVAMIIQVVDAKTSRILFSTTVEGKANDFNIGGALAGFGGHFIGGAGLGMFQKTPVEKAIRVAILEAVNQLSTKTPQTYFRHGLTPTVATPATTTTNPPKTNNTRVSAPVSKSSSILPATVTVKVAAANLRESAGTQSRVVATLKEKTMLSVQAEDKGWYFVQTEDQKTGWIQKSLTVAAVY